MFLDGLIKRINYQKLNGCIQYRNKLISQTHTGMLDLIQCRNVDRLI